MPHFFSVTRVRAILFREITRPRLYAWLNNGRDVKSVWSVHQRKILFSELWFETEPRLALISLLINLKNRSWNLRNYTYIYIYTQNEEVELKMIIIEKQMKGSPFTRVTVMIARVFSLWRISLCYCISINHHKNLNYINNINLLNFGELLALVKVNRFQISWRENPAMSYVRNRSQNLSKKFRKRYRLAKKNELIPTHSDDECIVKNYIKSSIYSRK